jgi:beta-glucosidase
VLLKNEEVDGSKLLPLGSPKKIALIGPLGNNQLDLLGTWHGSGDASKVSTVLSALKTRYPDAKVEFEEGCKTKGNDRAGIDKAVSLAKKSDIIIMAIGEDHTQSGEAASRSMLGLPGVQQELLEKVYATGKPVVVVLMAGRPLTIPWMSENIPAIVNAWHLGTSAGSAIVDVLSGDYNPSGKLVISFPRNVGQIPIYYSMKHTGRPFDEKNKYTSKYLDVSNKPLYPFGFGLSYTTFSYSDLSLSASEISSADDLTVNMTVTNSGDVSGEETAQLYIQDLFGSVTRPVKELKSYQKVVLQPGESKSLSFKITNNDLKFYDKDMKWTSEPGDFKVYVGGNSDEVLEASFKLK